VGVLSFILLCINLMCTKKIFQKLGSAMKLMDEIIALLGSKDGSLAEAFLKSKILIHKISLNNTKDAEWVNFELSGYPDDHLLPDYRVIQNEVFVNASNLVYQFNRHPIPLAHLSDEQKDSITKARMRHSVMELEKFVEKPGGCLMASIPPESYFLLQKGLQKGVYISQAWCEIGKSDVIKILSQLRNQLLEFILSLNTTFAFELSKEEYEAEKSNSPGFFNHSTFGDNATIVISHGDNNTIALSQEKFDVLEKTLLENGVSIKDVEILKNALKEDNTSIEVANKNFGPAVKAWMGNMFSKALDTVWQIDIGIVSGLLTTAIQKYYGWQ